MGFMDLTVFKPVVKELVQYYMEDVGNPTGGSLHLILLGEGISEDNLWYCQDYAEKEGDVFGYFLATLLRYFTVEEIEAMYEEGWYKGSGFGTLNES